MKKIVDFIKDHFLAFVIGAFVLILVLIFAIITINLSFSASLDLLVVPTDATVLIDGEEYQNGLYENLRIGNVVVQISREGFEPKEFEVELKRNEKTKIYTFLEGNDDWYKDADDDTKYLLDIIYEYEGEQQTVELVKKYPIMAEIPIVYEQYLNNYSEYVSYRIDGGEYNDCEQEFCLKITDITGGNRERALEVIKSKGYNPDDYEILYEDASLKGHA